MNISYINRRINQYIDKAAAESGLSKRFLYFDCIFNCALGRCTIRDYFIYKFFFLNRKGKKEFISGVEQNKWQDLHNDKHMQDILQNKERALHHFSVLIDRDWCGQRYNNTPMDYAEFERKHAFAIVKPLNLCGGEGIKVINLKTLPGGGYKFCKDNDYIIEELIEQDDELQHLYPYAVNTIRMVTYKKKLVAATLRIGRGKNEVDNLSAGGIAAGVDIQSGTVYTTGKTYANEEFIFHPDTGVTIPGYVIPKWTECKKLVKKAVALCEEIPIVGFDITIAKHGPAIIEVNEGTEIEAVQLPGLRGYRRILR